MVLLQDIYDEYEAQNVRVSAQPGPLCAATVEYKGRYAVCVNFPKYATMKEKKHALVHELGHCESGATHKLSSPYDLIEKHEYSANKAAALKWLPPEQFAKAFSCGLREMWELAEYFDLPQAFIEWAYRLYTSVD